MWIAGLRRFFRALAMSSSLRNATNPLGIAGAARAPNDGPSLAAKLAPNAGFGSRAAR